MPLFVVWNDDPDDPDSNVRHVADHGISQDEVEEVLQNPTGETTSDSSGRPLAFGITSTGRLIAVVYEQLDEDTVYPVTAYEPDLD